MSNGTDSVSATIGQRAVKVNYNNLPIAVSILRKQSHRVSKVP